MTEPTPTDEVRQVVVHPVVWPHLERWLRSHHLQLDLLPMDGDDLPTYVMSLDVFANDGLGRLE